MRKNDDWELGRNWIAVGLFAISLVSAAFFVQGNKIERLERERTALRAEMKPYQLRKVYGDLTEYYDAKADSGESRNP